MPAHFGYLKEPGVGYPEFTVRQYGTRRQQGVRANGAALMLRGGCLGFLWGDGFFFS